jgi:hypothetical protein
MIAGLSLEPAHLPDTSGIDLGRFFSSSRRRFQNHVSLRVAFAEAVVHFRLNAAGLTIHQHTVPSQAALVEASSIISIWSGIYSQLASRPSHRILQLQHDVPYIVRSMLRCMLSPKNAPAGHWHANVISLKHSAYKFLRTLFSGTSGSQPIAVNLLRQPCAHPNSRHHSPAYLVIFSAIGLATKDWTLPLQPHSWLTRNDWRALCRLSPNSMADLDAVLPDMQMPVSMIVSCLPDALVLFSILQAWRDVYAILAACARSAPVALLVPPIALLHNLHQRLADAMPLLRPIPNSNAASQNAVPAANAAEGSSLIRAIFHMLRQAALLSVAWRHSACSMLPLLREMVVGVRDRCLSESQLSGHVAELAPVIDVALSESDSMTHDVFAGSPTARFEPPRHVDRVSTVRGNLLFDLSM